MYRQLVDHLPLLRIYIPSTYVVFRFVAAGQLYITTASIAALTYARTTKLDGPHSEGTCQI